MKTEGGPGSVSVGFYSLGSISGGGGGGDLEFPPLIRSFSAELGTSLGAISSRRGDRK